MAFKWVQCRLCGNTLHIDRYPITEHLTLKRSGHGVCKSCIHAGHADPSLIVTCGRPFLEYLLEKTSAAR